MTEEEILQSPMVQAAMREEARKRALAEANKDLPRKVGGEIAALRNAAKHMHSALCLYDRMDTPPPIASDFTACFDKICARIAELAAARQAST